MKNPWKTLSIQEVYDNRWIKITHREVLTPVQRYNEYVMTTLRTMWGADLDKIGAMGKIFSKHFETEAQSFLETGVLEKDGQLFRLSGAGKLLADRVAMELFFETET
jgi:oxygen-independent coproporphyrinogen-3 oxidase